MKHDRGHQQVVPRRQPPHGGQRRRADAQRRRGQVGARAAMERRHGGGRVVEPRDAVRRPLQRAFDDLRAGHVRDFLQRRGDGGFDRADGQRRARVDGILQRRHDHLPGRERGAVGGLPEDESAEGGRRLAAAQRPELLADEVGEVPPRPAERAHLRLGFSIARGRDGRDASGEPRRPVARDEHRRAEGKGRRGVERPAVEAQDAGVHRLTGPVPGDGGDARHCGGHRDALAGKRPGGGKRWGKHKSAWDENPDRQRMLPVVPGRDGSP